MAADSNDSPTGVGGPMDIDTPEARSWSLRRIGRLQDFMALESAMKWEAEANIGFHAGDISRKTYDAARRAVQTAVEAFALSAESEGRGWSAAVGACVRCHSAQRLEGESLCAECAMSEDYAEDEARFSLITGGL